MLREFAASEAAAIAFALDKLWPENAKLAEAGLTLTLYTFRLYSL